MKRVLIFAAASLFCANLSAQTKTTKKASVQKSKVTRTTASKPSTPVDIRDRIQQRLKDSSAAATSATATTTVINGITVVTPTPAASSTANTTPATNTQANTTVIGTGNNIGTNGSSTTVGGNSVTSTTSSPQGRPIPGTIPVTPTNAADVGGKPITQEQTRNTSTDVNRTQMNAINGNQVASQAQNPANTTKDLNGNLNESYWGTNQIGENMWTPPNNVISGFTRDFPAIRGATWTRDNTQNMFTARYKTGDLWTTTMYNNNGAQMETRFEMPLVGTLPQPLTTFKSKQSALVDFNRISRVVRPGREELFEVRLSTGRIAYINSRGEEVTQ